MKKAMKVLSISLIAIMMISTVCFADGLDGLGFDVKPTQPNDGKTTDLVNTVLGVLQWAGIAIAVGMLIFLGIKYISKGVSEQAEIKKSLPIYLLGVVLILGASFIVGAIKSTIDKVD